MRGGGPSSALVFGKDESAFHEKLVNAELATEAAEFVLDRANGPISGALCGSRMSSGGGSRGMGVARDGIITR